MAADDQGAAAPRKGLPLWVILAGGGALAFVLWRYRGTSAATQQPLVPAVATDPNTGLPIDPLTGLPFQGTSTQPQSLTDWISKAEAWAAGQGHLNAGLVSKALYDYTNGNRLNEQEAGVLQKILTAVGYPPILLPWNGPTGTNPSSGGKGPYFHPNTWKWFGLQKGESFLGEPKEAAKGSGLFTALGRVGQLIFQPQANAPIYALVNDKGKQVWRRIDSAKAFAALPTGTQVATLKSYR